MSTTATHCIFHDPGAQARRGVNDEAAIIVFGPGGMDVARRAQAAIAGSEIHGFARRVLDADVTFDNPGEHLRSLFGAGTPVIGICAAGILIRF